MTESHAPEPHRRPLPPWFNLFLLLCTAFTTFMAGFGGVDWSEAMLNGAIYSGSLLAILLSHEMGHYIYARRNAVPASLPFFIPVPPVFSLFGTMGAVIVMRGRIKSRNALMEVGAAGPLAGMAVAVPLLLFGLSLSNVEPIPEVGLMEGQSLLYAAAKWAVIGPIPEGMDVMLHPIAWAAWIGLLVTMLNLLPIGQLDGGHIFYALFGSLHGPATRIFHGGLGVFGLGVGAYHGVKSLAAGNPFNSSEFWTASQVGLPWIFLGFMLFVLGRLSGKGLSHPSTDDQHLSPGHRRIGYLCLLIFVLTFSPVPIQVLGL